MVNTDVTGKMEDIVNSPNGINSVKTPEEIKNFLGIDFLPSMEQMEVICAPIEPVIVIAGAGAGKTGTMALRVAYLVATGQIMPEEVLGLTFTRKAASQITSRIVKMVRHVRRKEDSNLWVQPEISTYDAFVSDIYQKYALRVRHNPQNLLLNSATAWEIAFSTVTGNVEIAKKIPGKTLSMENITKSVIKLSDAISTHLYTAATYRKVLEEFSREMESIAPKIRNKTNRVLDTIDNTLALLDLVEKYEEVKKSAGYVSYNDKLMAASKIAQLEDVRDELKAQYKLVIIDEFQDTSVVQCDFLSSLFKGYGVTAVGDPNQAIYSFRGASASALTSFMQKFGIPGQPVKQINLTLAWRNDKNLLTVANRVAQPLREAICEKITVKKLTPPPDHECGKVQVAVLEHFQAEKEYLAKTINENYQKDISLAVLCRTNSTAAEIAKYLEDKGFPVICDRQTGILKQPEVVILFSLLAVVNDLQNQTALMKILDHFRVGLSDMQAISAYAKTNQLSFADAVWNCADPQVKIPDLTLAGRTRAEKVAAICLQAMAYSSASIIQLVYYCEKLLFLDAEIEVRRLLAPNNARRALENFHRLVRDYCAENPSASLQAFLAWVEAGETYMNGFENTVPANAEPEVKGAVRVITVHAAKGLEWDIVFVPSLLEGQFPLSRVKIPAHGFVCKHSAWITDKEEVVYPLRGDAESLPEFNLESLDHTSSADFLNEYKELCGEHLISEERRIAYVAFTRARHKLFLSAYRWSHTKNRPRISRFLTELCPELYEEMKVVSGAEKESQIELENLGIKKLAPLAEVEIFHPLSPLPDLEAVNPVSEMQTIGHYPAELQCSNSEYPNSDSLGFYGSSDSNKCNQQELARRVCAQRGKNQRTFEEFTQSQQQAKPIMIEEIYKQENRACADEGIYLSESLYPSEYLRAEWQAAALLLAEQENEKQPLSLKLGEKLTASDIVRILMDPEKWIYDRRRPLPKQPTQKSLQGTKVHQWIAQQYNTPIALDLLLEEKTDEELAIKDLEEAFWHEGNPWSRKNPYSVEESYITHFLNRQVVCNIDAVFRDGDQWQVVDWKTGHPPINRHDLWVKSSQINIYRYALANELQIDPEKVLASFCYLHSSKHNDEHSGEHSDGYYGKHSDKSGGTHGDKEPQGPYAEVIPALNITQEELERAVVQKLQTLV